MSNPIDHESAEPEIQYAPSDVIAVLDHLSDLIDNARRLPMSASILINQTEVAELLNNAREALPSDLVAADGIVSDATAVLDRADQEAELVMADARAEASRQRAEAEAEVSQMAADAEANATSTIEGAKQQAENEVARAEEKAKKIVAAAQAKAEQLISSENVSREAEERATRTIQVADARAQALAEGADSYCDSRLAELEELLSKVTRQTVAGRHEIANRPKFDSEQMADYDMEQMEDFDSDID